MNCAQIDKCGLESTKSIESDSLHREVASKKLKRAMIFCLFFMGVEVIGGIYANSLAILTDAAHLLCDISGFAISIFAIWATSWESTAIQSYGFFRLEILGALVSIQFIWLITGMLLYEAMGRLYDSQNAPVDGKIMLGVAMLGLFVNICMMILLGHGNHGLHLSGSDIDHGHNHGHNQDHSHDHDHEEEDLDDSDQNMDENQEHYDREHTHVKGEHQHISFNEHGEHAEHALVCTAKPTDTLNTHDDHKGKDKEHDSKIISKTTAAERHIKHHNLNLEGAYLHVFGDALQSIGVIIGGAAIWYNPEWKIIDVICTLIFSMLVLGTTIQMLKDILHILMESTPREINAQVVKLGLEDLPGVLTIHELHIWALTMGKILLTCHIRALPKADHDKVLQTIIDYLESRFKITHATIQIETAA